MAPVIKELERFPDRIVSRVCLTAQHREMVDQVLSLFKIVPDYDLDLMRPGQSLSELTSRVFAELDPVISVEKPDWVLVQGDTTSVMAASLVAFYRRIKVGHVEAGLRTGDKWQPFPEEINRKVTTAVADLHFAPTEMAKENLLRERVPPDSILVTGNPVIDALWTASRMPYDLGSSPLVEIPWHKRIILVTVHRRENFGDPLEQICLAIREIAAQFVDSVHLVYPVHMNPNVQLPVYELLGTVDNITLLPPLDYLSMVQLMMRSHLVLTDSGGIQEEAPGFGKPVLVLRNTTERPEAVASGTARVVGTRASTIIHSVQNILNDSSEYLAMARSTNPYGDGRAAERIVKSLI